MKWAESLVELLLLASLALTGRLLYRPQPAAAPFVLPEIAADQLLERFRSTPITILDLRPLQQYRQGSLRAATHLPRESFLKGIWPSIPKHQSIVLLADSKAPEEAHTLHRLLRKSGHRHVFLVRGGYPALARAHPELVVKQP